MSKKIIRILAITMVILAFSAPVLFLLNYPVIGTLILVAFAAFIITMVVKAKKNTKLKEKEFEEFKKNAHQVIVSIEDYEIKSNSWVDEINVRHIDSRIALLNQVTGNSHRNIQKVARNPNYVRLNIPYQGETIQYDFYIDKDPTTLRVILELKKETYLYVDKNNPDRKYLDLEFLNN